MPYQTMFQTLCSEKHLLHAWKEIKSKGSAGGIDGQTTEDFEKNLGMVYFLKSQTIKTIPSLLRTFITVASDCVTIS